MADGFDADLSEFRDLAVDLGRASSAMVAEARPVVKKGLDNIKRDTIAHLSDDKSWKHLERAVSYDITGLDGEVGYEDSGQGELAGIYEFGSVYRAPHPTLYPAASREAPLFEQAMADAAAKVLGESL